MAANLILGITANGKQFLESGDDGARQKITAAASAVITELENPGEQLARIGWGEPTRYGGASHGVRAGHLQEAGREASEQQAADRRHVCRPGSHWYIRLSRLNNRLVLIETGPARILKHLAANGIIKEVGQDQ
jgi:hypothetical protein